LAPEGVAEAISAGRLLKKNNVEFDVVYTSWLSRAIETVAVVVAAAVVVFDVVYTSWLSRAIEGSLLLWRLLW